MLGGKFVKTERFCCRLQKYDLAKCCSVLATCLLIKKRRTIPGSGQYNAAILR